MNTTRHYKTIFLSSLCLLASVLAPVRAQDKTAEDITGSWRGSLEINAIKIRLVFNITFKDSALTATMDSPDQGAKGIPMTGVAFDGRQLVIEAKNLMGNYTGMIVNDTLIDGSWTQGGRSFPLQLIWNEEEFKLNRPQEPVPPYPYLSEEIIAEDPASGARLAGTLTIPEGEGPFPLVVLISGSGQQNRNEELMGHKPFLVLADHLTRNGIAVMRYDDRGAGGSTGDMSSMTTESNAADALAVFHKVIADSRIDPARAGLLGHSEGALIAMKLAAENRKVRFIILVGGTGVTGEKVLLDQSEVISRLSGVSGDEIQTSLSLNRKIYEVLKKQKDNQLAREEINRALEAALDEAGSTEQEKKDAIASVNASLPLNSYDWFRYFIITDPSKFLKKTKCPVLAIFGEKDLQVTPGLNAQPMEKALKKAKNKDFTIKVMPGLNHLMQHSTTGLPVEYGDIEETMSPEVLDMIMQWVRGR